jgi:chromate reductase
MTIVGFAGSLRASSFNRMLLAAVAQALPEEVGYQSLDLSGLPLFNADLERQGNPESVEALRRTVREADGLLISTPEYNQGLPAVTKNAVDWLSRRPKPHPLEGRPVGIMGATPGRFGTRRAQADLRHVLGILGAHVMVRPILTVPHAGERFGEDGSPDSRLRADVASFAVELVTWVARFR